MKKCDPMDMPQPSEREVARYLTLWSNLPNYRDQEVALEKLFHNVAPSNDDLTSILLKVVALNQFYSTNIFNVYEVAVKIFGLKNQGFSLDAVFEDETNDKGCIEAIKKLKACGPSKTSRKDGKGNDGPDNIDIYSFATKYCAHHNKCENRFPIFDSFVEKILKRRNKTDPQFKAKLKERNIIGKRLPDLREYDVFKEVIGCFKEVYGLKKLPSEVEGGREITLRDVDRYLWQFGKDWFPKDYKNPTKKSGDVDVAEEARSRFKEKFGNAYFYVAVEKNGGGMEKLYYSMQKKALSALGLMYRWVGKEYAFRVWKKTGEIAFIEADD